MRAPIRCEDQRLYEAARADAALGGGAPPRAGEATRTDGRFVEAEQLNYVHRRHPRVHCAVPCGPAPRAHPSPSPSGIPAHPSPQPPAAASTGSYAAPTWHWGGAGPPTGRPLEAAARLVSWCWPLSTGRRHETNASVAHRQSLWQGVVPLQLAGGAAVAAPAQVASLLEQHAGEVYLEAAVAEVVAEA